MKTPARRLLLAALTLTTLALLGVVFLFTGSRVSCDEESDDAGDPALRCDFEIEAPCATVWRALTRTGEPRPYYFDAVLEAELYPGGRWRFLTDDRERFLAGGEIVTLDPRRRLVQTFRAADLDDPPSLLAIDLAELPGGCRIVLHHDGFPRRTVTYRRFRRAHPLAMSALASYLETGELPLRARLYTAIFKPGMKTFTVPAELWE